MRTRAIPERLRGVFATRHYTNLCLPLPYHGSRVALLYSLYYAMTDYLAASSLCSCVMAVEQEVMFFEFCVFRFTVLSVSNFETSEKFCANKL